MSPKRFGVSLCISPSFWGLFGVRQICVQVPAPNGTVLCFLRDEDVAPLGGQAIFYKEAYGENVGMATIHSVIFLGPGTRHCGESGCVERKEM